VNRSFVPFGLTQGLCVILLGFACLTGPALAQQSEAISTISPADKSTQTTAAKAPEPPARVELLETHIRFEANGDSRKEVHTRVRINNEGGVRQFARIAFGYNRSFEQVEIPSVHITHATGGTADILPSAISDQPDPVVADAPAYENVRVKSIRILGLAPGDLLEYRVISTVSHHPLAPEFWLDHSFDHEGLVTQETFELDLPSSRQIQMRVNPTTPVTATEKSGEGASARTVYRWERAASADSKDSANASAKPIEAAEPDVIFSTTAWQSLSIKLDERLTPGAKALEQTRTYEEAMKELAHKPVNTPEIVAKAVELTKTARSKLEKLEALYDFVSQKIATVGLPLGATGFAPRLPAEIVSSAYATPEDKFVLFAALSSALDLPARAALTGYCEAKEPARPSAFNHLLITASDGQTTFWLDPSLEVAPFGEISTPEEKCAFVLDRGFSVLNSIGHEWQTITPRFPFASFQRVRVDASITPEGVLNAKVHYTIRGENELLLRVTFHQSPREKWKEVAQLLALSDGFRGKITSASASDPTLTKQPFTVDYEISQPKFVDWSKGSVRIPALLPNLDLPDAPEKSGAAAKAAIDLGTPLNVETRSTLHLPAGTIVRAPIASSVERDYATFISHYAGEGNVVFASRHINFLLREVPASRAADYGAFLHAVQTDQAQLFTLDRSPAPPATTGATTPTAHETKAPAPLHP
jgi:hypothetical protein